MPSYFLISSRSFPLFFPREAFLFFTFPFPPANGLKPHWNDAITHRRNGSCGLPLPSHPPPEWIRSATRTPIVQWMLHLTSSFPREAFLFFFLAKLSSFFSREAFLLFFFRFPLFFLAKLSSFFLSPPANGLKPHWNDAITHRRKGSCGLPLPSHPPPE